MCYDFCIRKLFRKRISEQNGVKNILKKILIIGSLNMDMVVEMEQMPKTGETILGRSLSYIPGGKGANQACAVGKAGGRAEMLGCIGDDEFGRTLKENLAACHVAVDELKISREQPTGMAVINVSDGGDNSIVVIQGANNECDTGYLQAHEAAFENCDIVILQMEIPFETIRYAVQKAAQLGKTVILNPAPAPQELPQDILSCTDYLIPNETELNRLAGAAGDTLDTYAAGAEKFLVQGVKNVIVTMGDKGCLLVNKQGKELFEARKVNAVDTTAAGDCFCGSFAVAVSEGKSTGEAIRFANTASSIAVQRNGAQTSIPDRGEIETVYCGT